jgi:hypothetical protein
MKTLWRWIKKIVKKHCNLKERRQEALRNRVGTVVMLGAELIDDSTSRFKG